VIRSLFAAPLRGLRRATVWWSIGIAVLVALTVAFWPAFRGSSGISEAIEQLPAGIIQAFGLQDFGTPAGFLRGNLYELLVPLLLAAAAIALVNGQTAGDEAGGRLEIFLAQPVDRGAVFLARALTALLAIVLISAATLAVQQVSGLIVGLDIDAGLVTATIALCCLLAALHGALAYVVAAATGRPSLVLGLGVGVAVAGYVVAALFPLSDVLAPWRQLSPWSWALGGDPLVHPTEAWRYAALGIPTLALLGIGTWLVRRRDIPAP
jgi:ABC-2 type transport system permease protein